MPESLIAETGRKSGSRVAGRLRRAGRIPCVVYGLGMEPLPVDIAWPELRRALIVAGATGSIRLNVNGTEHVTLVREIQRHPVRRDVSHIDFLAVDPDEAVDVEVNLVLGGLEEGDEGNDVEMAMRTVGLRAKPGAIPSEIIVDAAAVRETGTLSVAALQLPAGVSVTSDADEVVATVPAKLAAAAELAAAAVAED